MPNYPTGSCYWSCIMNPPSPSQALLFYRSYAFSYSFCNWQFCDSFQQFSDSFLTHPWYQMTNIVSEHRVLPKRYFEKAMSRQSVYARGGVTATALSPSSFLLFEWWRELRATTKRVVTSRVGGNSDCLTFPWRSLHTALAMMLYLIFVSCCPRVAASPCWPDVGFTQLRPQLTQKLGNPLSIPMTLGKSL